MKTDKKKKNIQQKQYVACKVENIYFSLLQKMFANLF